MAKFIISAFADEAGSLVEEQIQALKDNDIHYIEPRSINEKNIINLNDEELKDFKRQLDENNIKVNSLGSPIGKYPINEEFSVHLKDFGKALKACEILETKNMRMFSFFVEQDKLKESKEEVINRLNIMVSLAKEKNINLCHENESNIYGMRPSEVKELLLEVDGLYGVFDAANYRMNNCDVIDGINATLTNLGYLHIKDAIYESQEVVAALEGEGKLDEIIEIVNNHTDDIVYLTLEPHLHVFDAYKDIDSHELKGNHVFKTNREAFDYAANALKKLLINNGYKKDEENRWIK